MKSNEKKAKSKRICVDDIISESVRREKINLIYDILTPKSA